MRTPACQFVTLIWALAVLLAGCGSESERSSTRADGPANHHAPGHTHRHHPPSAHHRHQPSSAGSHGHGTGHARSPTIPAAAKRTTVIGEVDGDTVDLAGLGSSRLIGVDTPEVYGGAECFGSAASAFTKRELPVGSAVYYIRGVEPMDRYGRDLVYVWLPRGTLFNALLAREGYAVTLTIPPNDRFAGLFHHLADAARAANRGLWSPSTCNGNASEPVGGAPGGGSNTSESGDGSGGATSSLAGDRDCADFRTQAQAQDYFKAKGGPQNDPDYLDADGDGVACEDLP